jgi:SAM-dependent MidA family methyltransferase
VDYGDAGPKLEPTLRGFKQHRLVEDVFRDVGEMDITADVDFGTLKCVGIIVLLGCLDFLGGNTVHV